jgi:hypothetical protein
MEADFTAQGAVAVEFGPPAAGNRIHLIVAFEGELGIVVGEVAIDPALDASAP